MGNIIKKMSDKVRSRFRGLDVFLPTDMTKCAIYLCIAVQAILPASFFQMTQGR